MRTHVLFSKPLLLVMISVSLTSCVLQIATTDAASQLDETATIEDGSLDATLDADANNPDATIVADGLGADVMDAATLDARDANDTNDASVATPDGPPADAVMADGWVTAADAVVSDVVNIATDAQVNDAAIDSGMIYNDAGVACPAKTAGLYLELRAANVWGAPDTPASVVSALQTTIPASSVVSATATSDAFGTTLPDGGSFSCKMDGPSSMSAFPGNLDAADFDHTTVNCGQYDAPCFVEYYTAYDLFSLGAALGNVHLDPYPLFPVPTSFSIASGNVTIRATTPWTEKKLGTTYCSPGYPGTTREGTTYVQYAGPVGGPLQANLWDDTTAESSWGCSVDGGTGAVASQSFAPALQPTSASYATLKSVTKRTKVGDVMIVWRDVSFYHCYLVDSMGIHVGWSRPAMFISLCGAGSVQFGDEPPIYPAKLGWK